MNPTATGREPVQRPAGMSRSGASGARVSVAPISRASVSSGEVATAVSGLTVTRPTMARPRNGYMRRFRPGWCSGVFRNLGVNSPPQLIKYGRAP